MARSNNKKEKRQRPLSDDALLDAVAAAQRRYRWSMNILSLLGAAAAFVALRLRTHVEPDTSGWREADASSYAHVRERIASVDASSFTPWDVIREITERRAKPLLLRGAMKTWPQAAARAGTTARSGR